MSLKIANRYGNVDVRQALPKRYAHISGERLQPLCRKLGIKYAPALVGFEGKKRYGYSPVFDGVVVSAQSATKLLKAIKEREARAKDPKVIAAKERAKQRRAARQAEARRRFEEECDQLGVDPSSRTAEWLRSGQISEDEAELIAFKTAYRHEYTDYDDQFDWLDFHELRKEFGHEEAVQMMRQTARDLREEGPIPATWPEYLAFYRFESPIAQALARTLKDPRQCHPTWFKEAEIAVRRAGLPLDSLSYEIIRGAIADLRFERSNDF